MPGGVKDNRLPEVPCAYVPKPFKEAPGLLPEAAGRTLPCGSREGETFVGIFVASGADPATDDPVEEP